MMNEKVDLKGSVILNPVPVVMVTSRGKDGKDNVFTVIQKDSSSNNY